MSDQSDETLFWEIMDQFIDSANQRAEAVDLGIVNAAMLNAAARFNAYFVAISSESKDDLKQDKDESVHKFGGEFKRRMAENLDDYIDNYKIYTRE